MNGQAGLSIIAVILGLLILSVFGAAAVSLISTQASISLQEEQGLQAFYIAEGGLQYALANRTYCNYNTPAMDLGEGSFFVNSVLCNAVLSGGSISNTATTVYLNSTPLMGFTNSGFTIPGTVGIDSEMLFCTGTLSNSFTGCERGYRGSTALAHTNYEVFQCPVQSTGRVSTGLLSGSVKRVTQINVVEVDE